MSLLRVVTSILVFFIHIPVSAVAQIPPFLTVPISGDKRIKEKYISAVVDHHVPIGYSCHSSNNCAEDGKLILTSGLSYLNYDGHSGPVQAGTLQGKK